MVKTRFYLDCRRIKADGLGTLKISIFKDNVRALVPLNFKIPPECWDSESQMAIGKYRELNPMLLQRKAAIDSFIFMKESAGEFKGVKSCKIKDIVSEHLYGPDTKEYEKTQKNNFKARFEAYRVSRSAQGILEAESDFYFGSLSAVFDMFSEAEFGVNLRTLYSVGLVADGLPFTSPLGIEFKKLTMYWKRQKNS